MDTAAMGDIDEILRKSERRIESSRSFLSSIGKDLKDVCDELKVHKKLVQEKNQRIKELEERLKLSKPSSSTRALQKQYNELNLKCNALIQENQQLKDELKALKTKRRLPLHSADDDHMNVIKMLKTPNRAVKVIKEEDESQSSIPASQSSQSSDFTPTQFTLPNQENIPPPESDTINATIFNPEDFVRATRRDSIDLAAGNVRLTSSLPYEGRSQLVSSSPVKPKLENSTQDIPDVIPDSFHDPDDEVANLLPTPKTLHKTRQSTKRTMLEMQHTNFATPTQSKTKLDFTRHPTRGREWVPEDFKVNEKKNNDIPYAYHVVVRGKARKCLHGKTCDQCDEFYKHQGNLGDNYQGPRWDDQEPEFDIVKTTSRHKEQWKNAEEPPNYANPEFPSTQEQIKIREEAQEMKLRHAYERLYSVLHDGKYVFRENQFNVALEKKEYTIDESVFLKYLEKRAR